MNTAKIISCAIAVAAMAGCKTAPQSGNGGYRSLFNGRDLSGWTQKGGGEVKGWKAENGLEDMVRDAWNWQSKNPNGYNE